MLVAGRGDQVTVDKPRAKRRLCWRTDYDALVDNLRRGRLCGAILDVFDPEPLPAESRLWSTPNLVIVPHVSSDDADVYMDRTLDVFFDNVARFLSNRPLRNRVVRSRQY